MSNKNHPPIENHISEIEKEIEKRRHKWTLSALAWLDFDDVKQIVLIHIFKKWEMYDPQKPLIPWVSVITAHQIQNVLRNVYGNYSRPCLRCPAMEGPEECRIYGTQCSSCALYKKWEDGKKYAHNVKMPVSSENHINEVFSMPTENVDLEKGTQNIHKKMRLALDDDEYKAYECLIINHKSDDEAIKKLNIKKNGLNIVRNMKKMFLQKAKELIAKNEIDFE
jgi:Fe-S-cluster containining protein